MASRLGLRSASANDGEDKMPHHRIARLLVAVSLTIAAGLGSGLTGATAFSTDQSDVWSAANESGWGIQFVQTGSAIFATMYVYGPSGQPIWYTATLEPQSAPSTWSGDLIVTSGPWFGALPFDPSAVGRRAVGTMTWSPRSVDYGTLAYSVDGIPITKTIYRYALRVDDFRGTYGLWMKITTSGCGATSVTGYTISAAVVTQGNNSLVVVTDTPGVDSVITCTFTGTYVQSGHFGQSAGTFVCSNGAHGTHAFYEMAVQQHAISGRMTFTDETGCTVYAALGGVRE
jgi:hypothetical protein